MTELEMILLLDAMLIWRELHDPHFGLCIFDPTVKVIGIDDGIFGDYVCPTDAMKLELV